MAGYMPVGPAICRIRLACWGKSRVRKSKRFATSFRPLAPKLSRAAGFAIFSGIIDRGIGRVNMVGGRARRSGCRT